MINDNKRELKLLEAWEPPPAGAGAPIGCLATTFTFDSVFFEEECLGRFLNLESNPKDDDAAYLVEREEKLSGICAAVLADQHHCKGSRNIRWDLLSARVQNGMLHAKVSLLHWAGWTRVIIASANLTPEGYRKNREIFAVLDYFDGSPAPIECLKETIAFLRDTMNQTAGIDGNPAGTRALTLLDRVSADARRWGVSDVKRNDVGAHAIFSGPGKRSVIEQIRVLWPYQQPPVNAWVTSPFFDAGPRNLPAIRLWELLRQRGDASLTFNVRAEKISGKKAIKLYAPKALKDAQPGGRSGRLETTFNAVYECPEDAGDGSAEYRPLHLKSIWLENDFGTGYLIGSSNFTSKGLGLTKSRNIEANLFFQTIDGGSIYKQLHSAYFDGTEIGPKTELHWSEEPDETETGEAEMLPLPEGFKTAIYQWEQVAGSSLILQFGQGLPKDWVIRIDRHDQDLISSATWKAQGSANELVIKLDEAIPPAGLEVSWKGARGVAWWPVVVHSSSSLPPPDELKNLSLDDLVNILSSARPLHQLLRILRRKQRRGGSENGLQETNPHKRVDTSNFLLQRTRRISWAFRAIRDKLEKPIATKETLAWLLYGPVGVRALAAAVSKEAKSPDERTFLHAELALELGRVRPSQVSGCLTPAEVITELRQLVKELESECGIETSSGEPAIQGYVRSVFCEALK